MTMNDTLYRIARYPAELIEQWSLADGTRLTLRPVLPQDAAPLGEMITSMSATSRRRRFHGAVNGASAGLLARMTCIDYRQQMALVVTCPEGDGETVVADARFVVDAEGSAEFGVAVADHWQRRGVGGRALRGLFNAAGRHGLRWLHGQVLDDNLPMLALTQRMGFVASERGTQEGCVRVEAAVHQRPVDLQQPWWRRLVRPGSVRASAS
jgi:acetyltransferase